VTKARVRYHRSILDSRGRTRHGGEVIDLNEVPAAYQDRVSLIEELPELPTEAKEADSDDEEEDTE
jgi:hypothetical protein